MQTEIFDVSFTVFLILSAFLCGLCSHFWNEAERKNKAERDRQLAELSQVLKDAVRDVAQGALKELPLDTKASQTCLQMNDEWQGVSTEVSAFSQLEAMEAKRKHRAAIVVDGVRITFDDLPSPCGMCLGDKTINNRPCLYCKGTGEVRD